MALQNIQRTDHDTNSLFSINVEHAMIHLGRCFFTEFTWDVAASTTEKLYLKFPAGKECHFRYKMRFNDDIEYKIYEDGEYDAGGVSYTLLNRKRHSLNSLADLLIIKEATMTADGDQVLGGYIGANKELSELNAEHEIIYKGDGADKVVMIEIINGAGDLQVSVDINIYVPEGEGQLNA